jgi:RimJ/RimL family protein N-acetyltransferase
VINDLTLTRDISDWQRSWRNHPEIRRWTRQNGLLSEVDQKRWLEKIENDPSIQMFGILAQSGERDRDGLRTQGDKNIGTCGLTSINREHGTAEFSLLIGPQFQKQGFGKKALIKLFGYGFRHLRLNCIWGETFENNPAMKMFKQLGMIEEGKCRQRYFKNGFYVDSSQISILRSEAEQQWWWPYSDV